jgi:hypothetical protein
LEKAAASGAMVFEPGGWATSNEGGSASRGITLACSAWSVFRSYKKPVVALGTATARHASADMLRKLGGTPLIYQGKELPPFHDPFYGCQMELLSFDQHVAPEYQSVVQELDQFFRTALVIAPLGGTAP